EVNGMGDDTTPGAVVEYKFAGSTVEQTAFLFDSVTLEQCAGPQGMDIIAFGPREGNLALGCNAPSIGGAFDGIHNTIWVDGDNPNTVTAFFPDKGGADQVWTDRIGPFHSNHVFVTGGSHLPQEQLTVLDSLTVSNDPQNPSLAVPSQQTIFVGFIG